MRDYLHGEAMQVDGVAAASVEFSGLENRKLIGDIRITDSEGNTQYVAIS